jgi:flagellar biosynthesis anti-sigma factor FlgM
MKIDLRFVETNQAVQTKINTHNVRYDKIGEASSSVVFSSASQAVMNYVSKNEHQEEDAFDTDKVEKIRQAIANGEFSVDVNATVKALLKHNQDFFNV